MKMVLSNNKYKNQIKDISKKAKVKSNMKLNIGKLKKNKAVDSIVVVVGDKEKGKIHGRFKPPGRRVARLPGKENKTRIYITKFSKHK